MRRLAVILCFSISSLAGWSQPTGGTATEVHALSTPKIIGDSISAFTNALPRSADSISALIGAKYGLLRDSYDSASFLISNKIQVLNQGLDSLKRLSQPAGQLAMELDSLHQQQEKLWNETTSKLESMKSAVRTHIEQLPPEIQDKTYQLASLLDGLHMASPLESLPTPFRGSIDISALTILPESTPALQEAKLFNSPELKLSSTQLTGVSNSLSQVVTEYPDLQNAVEKKISDAVPLDDFQRELKKGTEVANGLRDEEAVKQEVLSKVEEQTVNYFAGKEGELAQAMETLSKYRKKYGSFENLEDLAARHRNVLHDAPLIERLMPGLGLQLFLGEAIMVDLNPYLGYRFNERLTMGAGWNERVALGSSLLTDSRVYGPRIYAEHAVWRSIIAHIEAEYLNTFVPTKFSSAGRDAAGREWVFTPLGGIKKEYSFIKSVKGTFYMLYNLHDPFHRSPYTDKLVIKMGFEFPIKKKGSSIAQ